jgi:hypothetical protein
MERRRFLQVGAASAFLIGSPALVPPARAEGIWNWRVHADWHGGSQAALFHTVTVQSDVLPQGVNVFAYVYLTQVLTHRPQDANNTSGAYAYIGRYAVWQADGTQSAPINISEQHQNSQFIKNCAWVSADLAVRECDAIANLTLMQW